MPEFQNTAYGKRFFDGQLPKLIKELGRIADALEEQNKLKAIELKQEAKKDDTV